MNKETSIDGEGDFDLDAIDILEPELDPVHEEMVREKIHEEVGNFIANQIENGEEPDYDLIIHMDELLNEG